MKKKSVLRTQRGSTVALMAGCMVFMVAMAALAIDVVALYVIRSEAQRAADAAALAGAHVFVNSGLTSGLVTDTSQICDGDGSGSAQQAAMTVAAQNSVGGQPGLIFTGDIQCDFSRTQTMNGMTVPVNPLITVRVTRQNIPTFFSRVWGNPLISSVHASATAEAFNMTGNGTLVQTQSSCLKPFFLPNLDPDPNHNVNGQPDKLIDAANGWVIKRPGYVNSGGVIGYQFTFLPGDPTKGISVGQFAQIQFSSTPTLCPSGPQCPSGDPFQDNIQCCNSDNFSCGNSYSVLLTSPTSQTQQDTFKGTSCMIHGPNLNGGADNILVDPPPFRFIAGSNNPIANVRGTRIGTSDSVVTVPIFDQSGPLPATLPVVGFLQVFIQSVDGSGTVTATILNVVGCAPGITAPIQVSGGGISPIPVRLVQAPGN